MLPRPKADCKELEQKFQFLADQVAAILENVGDNAAINFSLGVIRVTPLDLAKVGRAIRDGKVHVTVGDPGSMGFYDGDLNTITLPSLDTASSLENRGGVIHEGVHAVNDMNSLTVLDLDDEASAYIAQGVYNRVHVAKVRSGTFKADGTPIGNLRAAMVALADQVIAGKQLDATDLKSLKDAIVSIPYYSLAGTQTSVYTGF
jgi:hypothetical protein